MLIHLNENQIDSLFINKSHFTLNIRLNYGHRFNSTIISGHNPGFNHNFSKLRWLQVLRIKPISKWSIINKDLLKSLLYISNIMSNFNPILFNLNLILKLNDILLFRIRNPWGLFKFLFPLWGTNSFSSFNAGDILQVYFLLVKRGLVTRDVVVDISLFVILNLYVNVMLFTLFDLGVGSGVELV